MGFADVHSLTHLADGPSVISSLFPGVSVQAGTYDGGLITVVDTKLGPSLLRSWVGLGQFSPLMVTAFGDVYALDSEGGSIYWLNTQHGLMDFVEDEIAWVMDEFLDIPGIVDAVLQGHKFRRLQKRHRDLRYPEVFVLEPWLMLGGSEEDVNYSIRRVDVYLDLVGQARGDQAVAIEGFE